MSLRIKVLLILVLICLGGGYWAYTWVFNNIRPQFLRVMEDDMVDHAYLLARLVETSLPNNNPQKALARLPIGQMIAQASQNRIDAQIYEWKKEKLNYRLYITDAKGIVRVDTDHSFAVGKDYSRWNDVYHALRGKYGARSSRATNSQGVMVNAMYVAFPMYKNGRIIGALTLSKSKASLTGWAMRAQEKLWQGVLLGASALFLLAFFATQAVIQPIFRLTQYAKAIAAGRRVDPPEVGSDEIGLLTQSFIEMKESLWQRQDLESFVTQLTHELKSPISAICGAAELLEDPNMPSNTREHFLQNIQNQTSRMNDIVQRLLTLVSLEQRERLETRDAVEIDGLLKEMEDRFLAQAQQQQIELQFQRQETAPSSIEGDRFLLAQAIANLLQNSLNFTPSEGTIQVQVSQQTDENEGHQLIIQITDNGPGIPDYALDRVLERFYSLEHPNGRKGTGLGLPFVKQVALLHGGDFHIQNGQKNGVLAVFWIPL